MKLQYIRSNIVLMFLIVFISCSETKTIKNKYTWFDNISHINSSYFSLNNFKPYKHKNGIEYIVNKNGEIIEIRNWKDDYLNGYSFRYSNNGKLYRVGNYINDTINGNFFSFDTITGTLIEYREKAKIDSSIIDNKVIVFNNGKIDLQKSSFISASMFNNDSVLLVLHSSSRLPYLRMYVTEQIILNNNIDFINDGKLVESNSNYYVGYKVMNKESRYLVGCILNYRIISEEESKKTGLDKNEPFGPLKYFRIKLINDE